MPEPVQIALFAATFALSAWGGIWASKDAERRGKPGCLVGALVFLLAFPVGPLTWLAFRPPRRP